MIYFIIFLLFGSYYITFEVFFNALYNKNKSLKGYSSIYMFLIGGMMGIVFDLYYKIPLFHHLYWLWLFCIIGGVSITIIELLSGLLLNKVLKLNIWSYKDFKFNFMGQIELYHSLGWLALSIIIFFIISGFRFFINDINFIDFIVQYFNSLR